MKSKEYTVCPRLTNRFLYVPYKVFCKKDPASFQTPESNGTFLINNELFILCDYFLK